MPKKPKQTWTSHKQKWENCTQCDLCEGRNKIVLGKGTVPAEVLLIGEAPGASEDILGKPFVGNAGKLLDDIIEEAMYASRCRPSILFTNLISCIPKDETGQKVQEPPKESIEACSTRLQELTELAKPQAIIKVGKLSQKWFPKLIDYDFEFSIDIIHPAALLRMDVSQKGLAIQRTTVQIRDLFEKLVPF